ncbi:hypothetical protein BH10BAC5_BH10BAC5_27830 [soil metagenome]
MKKYYGPFMKDPSSDKWHWKEKCPFYPVSKRIISMISTKPIDYNESCSHCLKLESIEKSVIISQKKEKFNTLSDFHQKNNILLNGLDFSDQHESNSI